MKFDKTMNDSLKNDEIEKMKRIMINITHPNNQKGSISNSITKPQIENKPFLTETDQKESNQENHSDKSVISNNSDNPDNKLNNIKIEINERLITQNDNEQEKQNNDNSNNRGGMNKFNLNNIVIQTNNKQEEHELNSDDEIIDKDDAIQMAKDGKLKNVGIAHRKDTEYLKTIPDNSNDNNLS